MAFCQRFTIDSISNKDYRQLYNSNNMKRCKRRNQAGISIVYHQGELKLIHKGFCRKNIFTKFTYLSAWGIWSQLSKSNLYEFDCIHILLRWIRECQFLKPFHFIHLEDCFYHTLSLLEKYLLKSLNKLCWSLNIISK